MKKKILLINLAVILILAVVVIIAGISGSEYYTAKPEFCGSCHMMKRYYDSWKNSRHGEKDIVCLVCHYAPNEKYDVDTNFRGLGQLLTYLSSEGKKVRMPTKVDDLSCTASDCHPAQKFMNKESKFMEKVPFSHKTHEEKTIEVQKLHCDTCHQNLTAEEHFEVSKKVCFLCHFKNTDFNEGRAKCSLCHEVPTKPLQKQKQEGAGPDEKPITHQSLEKSKVPCQSCHYELIKGEGEVIKQNCFNCHNFSFQLETKAEEKKLMHTEHVEGQLAKCFECHKPIQHQKTEFLDSSRLHCLACHPNHHIYQKMLLIGDERKGVSKRPSLMHGVNTTCLGCHRDERVKDGEKVMHGTGKACAACHTERHEGMAKEWKDKTGEELKIAKEMQKHALYVIEDAKGKIPQEELEEAMAMFQQAQENLNIVEYGGGVHNKEYSIMLIDAAMASFKDAVDFLSEEGEDEKEFD